jgi:hypothetical protein
MKLHRANKFLLSNDASMYLLQCHCNKVSKCRNSFENQELAYSKKLSLANSAITALLDSETWRILLISTFHCVHLQFCYDNHHIY